MRRRTISITVMAGILIALHGLAAVALDGFGDWSPAVDIEAFGPGAHEDFNTPSTEGCPFTSPDGKMFFMASNRPGGLGDLDIWVSTRERTSDPWGAPVNLGAPVNSAANDFCPTVGRDGHTFFFVSNRSGHCGTTANGDIYTTRLGEGLETRSVTHLGCDVNSPFEEHSPFPINVPGDGPVLFYSSTRPGFVGDPTTDHDIYMSRSLSGVYGVGEAVEEVNTANNDAQPNVRRDGLELFLWSDRPGSQGPDIYQASRSTPLEPWSTPVNLGLSVNSSAGETRPSLSWDGTTLYFGSTRNGGQSDVYVTTR